MNQPFSKAELEAKYGIDAIRNDVGREASPIADQIQKAIDDTPKYSPVAAFHGRVRHLVEVVMRGPIPSPGWTLEEQFEWLDGFMPGCFYSDPEIEKVIQSSSALRAIFRATAEASLTGPTGVQRLRVLDRDSEQYGKAVSEHIIPHPYTPAKVAAAVLGSLGLPCCWCHMTPEGWEFRDSVKVLRPKRERDALLVTCGSTVVALPTCVDCKVTLQGEVASDRPGAMGFDFLSNVQAVAK